MRSGFRRSVCVIAGAILAFLPRQSDAQDSTVQKPNRLCWRGRPVPACNAFLLTEFNFFRAIVNPSATFSNTYSGVDGNPTTYSYEVHPSEWKFSAEVGGMVNRGNRNAFGGTVLIDGGPEGGSIGLKARYRRWLTPEGVALDFGAGIQTTRDKVVGDVTYPSNPSYVYRGPQNSIGLTGDVAINAGDYVAIVSRVDVNKFGRKYQPTVSLGVRAGSRPAVFALGGIAVTYGALIAIFLAAWDE